ncbi:MAG: hypothetical protein QOH64_1891, partial [Acidimicrobiaceae bacterium]
NDTEPVVSRAAGRVHGALRGSGTTAFAPNSDGTLVATLTGHITCA